MKVEYSVETAVRRLEQNGIKVIKTVSGGTVKVMKQPGIKLWGAIDFLRHHAGFSVHFS